MGAPVAETDHENTARPRELLAERDWFDDSADGAGAQSSGWLLAQHADDDPDYQREVLRRLERHLDTGRVSRSDYAMLWDRVAVKEHRPQRYGSQLACEGGERVADGGVEYPDNLDAKRAAFGLQPWRDYQALIGRLGSECIG